MTGYCASACWRRRSARGADRGCGTVRSHFIHGGAPSRGNRDTNGARRSQIIQTVVSRAALLVAFGIVAGLATGMVAAQAVIDAVWGAALRCPNAPPCRFRAHCCRACGQSRSRVSGCSTRPTGRPAQGLRGFGELRPRAVPMIPGESANHSRLGRPGFTYPQVKLRIVVG
jgi:hypothetical protein